MKKALFGIGVALFFGAFCITSCTDEKDEANSSSTENTSNTSNPSGGTGTSGGSGVSGANRLPKGDARMVDLGLPSGTLWADRNIGATSPEDYGAYFAWGEISPKSDYTWSTYLDGNITNEYDCGTDKDIIWCKYGDKADIAGTSYDAATANWGAGYKMPTKEQCEELLNEDYTTWTYCDGWNIQYNNTHVHGFKIESKTNGNSIFLPAAGFRDLMDTDYAGSRGYYWSSSLDESVPRNAMEMKYFNSGYRTVYHSFYREYGLSVRAVSE